MKFSKNIEYKYTATEDTRRYMNFANNIVCRFLYSQHDNNHGMLYRFENVESGFRQWIKEKHLIEVMRPLKVDNSLV